MFDHVDCYGIPRAQTIDRIRCTERVPSLISMRVDLQPTFTPWPGEFAMLTLQPPTALHLVSFLATYFVPCKISGVDAVQGRGLRIRGTCAFYQLACLPCMFSVSALCLCQLIFVAQGSCLFAPHPQPPYGTQEYTACAQAVAQAFRPYAFIFACICCCLLVFIFLPIHIRKSAPCFCFPLRAMNLCVFFIAQSPLE